MLIEATLSSSPRQHLDRLHNAQPFNTIYNLLDNKALSGPCADGSMLVEAGYVVPLSFHVNALMMHSFSTLLHGTSGVPSRGRTHEHCP